MEPIIVDGAVLLGYSGGMALYVGNWMNYSVLYLPIIWWDHAALCINFSTN
jgi:hypothetical protein